MKINFSTCTCTCRFDLLVCPSVWSRSFVSCSTGHPCRTQTPETNNWLMTTCLFTTNICTIRVGVHCIYEHMRVHTYDNDMHNAPFDGFNNASILNTYKFTNVTRCALFKTNLCKGFESRQYRSIPSASAQIA